jgi:tetratricopeptide (TPR) repeat protein
MLALKLISAALLLLCLALPARAQTTETTPAELMKAGAAALDARRFAEAFGAFQSAATIEPRNASAWFGGGVSAFMLGRNGDAETLFARALELQPALTDASVLLGDLQYRSGRLAEAIATYQAGLKHAPQEKRFTSKIAAWTTELRTESRFYTSRGAHFRVLFEGPANDALARRVVEMLEAAYSRVGGALTAYPTQPIDVVLYTQQQFRDVTQMPPWAVAAYDGRIRIATRGVEERPGDMEATLTHEFVHAVVAMLGGRSVPAWLHEGLATAFESSGVADARRVLASAPSRTPLASLHRSFAGLSVEGAAVAYAQSTVAVRKMLDLAGAPAIVTLLRDLARGVPFEAAFHQRMSMPYLDFQRFMGQQ